MPARRSPTDAPEAETLPAMHVGARLREARLAAQLSLRAAGELTGFSASFLSQVELGQAMPSLASLQRITEALGVRLPDLLTTLAAKSSVLRRVRREAVHSEWSRATAEVLIPQGSDDRVDAVLLRLEANGRSGKTELKQGRRLFAYAVSGTATLVLDGDELIKVEAGDSIALDGPRQFAWENRSRRPASLLSMVIRFTG